jgi:hypothetical protein
VSELIFPEGAAAAVDGARAFADDAAGLYGVVRSIGLEAPVLAGLLRRARAQTGARPSPVRLMAALRGQLRQLRPEDEMDCYGTFAGVDRGRLTVAHVGRCHAALVRPKKLEWLTTPQQASWWGAELIGRDPEPSRRFPYDTVFSSLVVKSFPAQVVRRRVAAGDALLVVSSPVIRELDDDALVERIVGRDPRDAARDLVRSEGEPHLGAAAVVVRLDA